MKSVTAVEQGFFFDMTKKYLCKFLYKRLYENICLNQTKNERNGERVILNDQKLYILHNKTDIKL